MTDPRPELERTDELEADRALASYVAASDESPSPGFVDWVMESVAVEPAPRRGLIAVLGLWLAEPGPLRLAAQVGVITLVLAAGIGSALAISNFGSLLPAPGSSPTLSIPPPAGSPTPTPTPSPTPTATPTPSPTPQASPAPQDPTPSESEDEDESSSDESGPHETDATDG
jgi:hypothetical protein